MPLLPTLLLALASAAMPAAAPKAGPAPSRPQAGEHRPEVTQPYTARTFPLKRLAGQRTARWAAYLASSAARDSALALPDPPQLTRPWCDSITLPASLEQQAVMAYYWGAKGARPAEGYPAYIYLHGSGPRAAEWATGLTLARRFADAPSLYFIPRIPREGEWYRWWQRGKLYVWERLFRALLRRPDTDPARLYLFGISEGGYGSQRLASYYADYLAAAGPMAGGEPLINAPAENLRHTPFSLLTGALDAGFYRNRLTPATGAALDSLAARCPGDYVHRVSLIPGRGHGIDYSPTTPWLSQWRRTPLPAAFSWEDYPLDGRYRRGFYYLRVDRRPSGAERTRYDVSITGDTVRLDARLVTYTTTASEGGIPLSFARTYAPATDGQLTLFLSPELLDLSRPVTLIVNGRTAFRGRLRLSADALEASLALFGDPLRLLPAALSIRL